MTVVLGRWYTDMTQGQPLPPPLLPLPLSLGLLPFTKDLAPWFWIEKILNGTDLAPK